MVMRMHVEGEEEGRKEGREGVYKVMEGGRGWSGMGRERGEGGRRFKRRMIKGDKKWVEKEEGPTDREGGSLVFLGLELKGYE